MRGARFYGEGSLTLVCLFAAVISVGITIGVISSLLFETIGFFQRVSFQEFATAPQWTPNFSNPQHGIRPLLTGTFMIVFGSAVIALPIGLLIAIYLSEYAHPRTRRIIKPMLELLAGIPSVVFGFFGLVVVTPFLKNLGLPLETFNALSGSLVVGMMVLPLVASLSEDAIASVPRGTREAAYGLGASRAEVSITVVLRSAVSGIIASFILAISRAVGETLAVTLAAGANPTVALDFTKAIQTMTAYIVEISKGDAPRSGTAYQALFAVGLTLFIITLGLNLLAQRFVKRYQKYS